MFGAISALLAGWSWYSGGAGWPWFLGAGGFFLIAGLLLYPVLRPVYIGWMRFAQILAWINTRLILGLAFYLVITPISVVFRLLGKDLIGQRIDRNAATYWKPREGHEASPERYKRLF